MNMNVVSSGEVSRVMSLARETTSLDLLADIDATIDKLAMLTRNFQEITTDFLKFEAYVSSSHPQPGDYIDPNFQNISDYEEAEAALKAFLPRTIARRAAIDRDPRLKPEHRGSLHDAYEDAMTTAAILHEAIQATRHAVIRHDIEAEPREELPVFDTVEALIADLHR